MSFIDRPARHVIKDHWTKKPHRDLRLEDNGRGISFVLPGVISLIPGNPMSAIQVEDHKVSGFYSERVIPEGEYGAGPMSVWDMGIYRNITKYRGRRVTMDEALRKGFLAFWLDGIKLRGGFSLRRVHSQRGNDWELLKLPDEFADGTVDVVSAKPLSVRTGRTMEQIARGMKRPIIYPGQLSFDF